MALFRKTGLQVSVFKTASAGPDYIDDLENATLQVEVSDEDAAGIKEVWEIAWATGKRWQLEADVFVGGASFAAASAYLVTLAAGSALVDLTFTSGGNTYAGTGLITMASHTTNKKAVQKQRCTIKGQGALTVTAPA